MKKKIFWVFKFTFVPRNVSREIWSRIINNMPFFLKNKGKQAGNDWADIQQVETNINLKEALGSAQARIINAHASIEEETQQLSLKDVKE